MTYPDQLVRLIDERADRRIAYAAQNAGPLTGLSAGTVVSRTGATTCQITLDGSTIAVPVKVFGDVELLSGDRVGLARLGTDWTVFGTFTRRRRITMPDGATTGQQRMVWGADTPPELQSYGLTVAMQGYVLDPVSGLEVGYFFQAVSNQMDSPQSMAMVFGNVTYVTPGNPATATLASVKTNVQFDLWSQFRNTIFKDHSVDLWYPATLKYDSRHAGRGLACAPAFSSSASGLIGAETVMLTMPNALYRAGRAYRFEVNAGLFGSSTVGQYQIRRTNLAGPVLWASPAIVSNATFGFPGDSYGYLSNATGSDITQVICLTLQPLGGGNINHLTIGAGRTFSISDVGVAADWTANAL